MPRNLVKRLEDILFITAGLGLLGSIGLAFTAVILRYGFNHSLEWIEEGARYLALFSAFLVAGPVLRNHGHVALDIVPSALHAKGLAVHRLVVGFLALLVSLLAGVWGVKLTLQTYQFGMRTGSLQFPQWLPYSIVPLGMTVLAIFSLVIMIEALQSLRKSRPPKQSENNRTMSVAGSGE